MASITAPSRSRPAPVLVGPAPADSRREAVQLIGHAGLAIGSDGGAPTRGHLDEALDIDVDRLEVDICNTADDRLVVRHDLTVGGGALVGDLDLAGLRALAGPVLTLDDVVDHLGGSLPLLLDIKTARAAELLGAWFNHRRDLDGFALCTENISWLLHCRFAAPRVQRWPSFPDLGEHRTHHVQRVIEGLWRTHSSLPGLRQGVADVQRVARKLGRHPRQSLGSLAGLPWRGRLPGELEQISRDLAASGMCVHHCTISGELVEEAHRLGLHVNAWTVNNPFAARDVSATGVDSITSDRVDLVRRALGPPPRTRPEAGAVGIRAAVRNARS